MDCFILLSFAFLLTTVLVPLFIKTGKKYGIIDKPTARKVHTNPIARTGGFAVFFGSMIPFALYAPKNRLLLGIALGAGCIFVVGAIDDIRELNCRWKFLGQLVAVCITLLVFRIRTPISIQLRSGLSINFRLLSLPFYFLFLVSSINIINLADGLDGLASGICLLIFCCTAFFAFISENYLVVVLCMCMMGGLIGFMRYNTYPAIVFLGDTGSLFLGYAVGVSMILLYAIDRITSPITPLFIIGVPIIDTSLVILDRYMDKRPIFQPDKNHLHHRLLKIGFKHNEAVMIIYGMQLLMIVLAWLLWMTPDGVMLGIYLFLITTAVLFLLAFKKKEITIPRIHGKQEQVQKQEHRNHQLLSRNTVSSVAWHALIGGMFLFCLSALLAVRSSIPKDIGFISLGLIPGILFLNRMNSKYIRQLLKLSAYFICLYLVYALDCQTRPMLSLYNTLFMGMGICYLVYIIASVESIPFFNMDCLFFGVIILVFFLSKTFPWLAGVESIVNHTLFTFFFIELIFSKYKERKLLWPICLTLMATGTLAFCFS
ncbi:MAG: MraY family glycosyltransferase [bacterium]